MPEPIPFATLPEATQQPPFLYPPSSLSPSKLSTSTSKLPRPILTSSLSSSATIVSRVPPPSPKPPSPPRPSPEELRLQRLMEEEEERRRKEEHEARIAQVVSNIFVKWRYWAPMNRKRREKQQFEQFVQNFNESAYLTSTMDAVAKLNGSPNFISQKTKLKFSPFPPPPRIQPTKTTSEPLDVPKLIYGSLQATNPSANILFWKIVICTPTRKSTFVDWLTAKFERGPRPALAEFPRTLALYRAQDFYFEIPGGEEGEEEMARKELKVCVTHVQGLPSKNDLAGAQAIINVVDSQEGPVTIDNMRTISYLLSAPIPLAALLFNFSQKDKKWVENMEQCVGDVRKSKKVSEARVIKMSEQNDTELQDLLKWLSAHSPAQPNLVKVDAGTLLDNLLAQQVAPLLTPFYSLSSPSAHSSLSSFGVNELVSPQDIIEAYNDLVAHVESQLTMDMDHRWSWPVPEFISTNPTHMPPITWNKPETLVRIHNAFRAITMRALPREFRLCVATQVFSVAPKSTTLPQLQTQAMENLYEATLQILNLGPSKQSRSAAAPLIESVQNLFTQQTNAARVNIDEVTLFPWHRIFALFFCYLVDSLTASDLRIFSLANNIPSAKRPPRRKYTSECLSLVLPMESPSPLADDISDFADITPTLKRKFAAHDEARQQKQKFSSPSSLLTPSHSHSLPSSSSSSSPYESMLAERFSTYVAKEREQSRAFDELMRDMIDEIANDTPMNDVSRHNDLDILMQELEREKSRQDRLEHQLHHLHS